MPPLSPALRRVHAVVRWIPFFFIVGIVTFGASVLLDLHIRYTLIRRGWFLSSVFNILVVCLLAGLGTWSFLVAVLKSPGHPKGVAQNGQTWDQRGTGGESRWERRERLREEQVGLTNGGDLSEEEEDDDEAEGDIRRKGERREDSIDDNGEGTKLFASTEREDPSAEVFDANGAGAFLPGQPRMPARTGRSQLNDIMAVVERAKRQRNDGRLFLGDLQVKNTGGRRWCKQCQTFKPDRAHHCSTCGVCVLRMDHHCPWLASRCIGLRNHKAFFLFLTYTALFCCFAAQDTGRALIRFVEDETNGYQSTPITWAVVLFLGAIFGLALGPFAVYHAYLICRNRTTLESMEGAGRVRISVSPQSSSTEPLRESVSDRLRKLARIDGSLASASEEDRSNTQRRTNERDAWRRDEELSREERKILRKANKLNIYSIDVKRNWQSVMGQTWPMWLVPIGDPEGDGYTYEVNETTLRELESITAHIRDDRPSERGLREPVSGRANVAHRKHGAFSSSSISSIRSKARSASDASKGIADPHSTSSPSSHARHKSAHGLAQWGSRPKKDFILYGLGDEDEDSGGVLDHADAQPFAHHSPSSLSLADNRRSNSPPSQYHATQMDADVWRE